MSPRHHVRRAAVTVLLAAVAAGLPGAPSGATLPAAAPATLVRADPAGEGDRSLKDHYDDLTAEEVRLVERVQALSQRRTELLLEVQHLQLQLGTADRDLLVATAELQRAERRARQTRVEVRRAERRVTDAEAALREQLVAAYIRGEASSSSLESLLDTMSRSAGDVGTRLEATRSYSDAVVDHQQELIDALVEARTERERAEARARASTRAAERLRTDVEVRRQLLQTGHIRTLELTAEADRGLAELTMALQEVAARKIEVAARVTQLEKASDGVSQLLAAAQAGQPDYRPGDILFQSPVPGATVGSEFGMRMHPILGYERLHAGVDTHSAAGDPIHAAADGIVLSAGDHDGYGNATIIDHGFAVGTLYGHQSTILVQTGQVVRRGELIGLVGSTGLSTGPHLHFETRVRGVPIDPATFVDLSAPPPPPDAVAPGATTLPPPG